MQTKEEQEQKCPKASEGVSQERGRKPQKGGPRKGGGESLTKGWPRKGGGEASEKDLVPEH